jgi:hypothetical protein
LTDNHEIHKNLTFEREDLDIIDFKDHPISKYYDIEKLKTQTIEEIYQECERLEKLTDIKILEKNNPRSSYVMARFKESIRSIFQLDALTEYFKYRIERPSRDRKLKAIYGRLPDWRIEEKKKLNLKK